MENEYTRTSMLLGEQGIERLKRACVAVFGIGGVGSYTAEALARGGIGRIILCDSDVVNVSNINRQLPALHSTIGMKKTGIMRERIHDINPSIDVRTFDVFYSRDTAGLFDFSKISYIADAIDSVTSKLLLIETAYNQGVNIISSMGAGNKLDPCAFEVADIYETSVCPLARVMRRELKKRGVERLKVVFSKETPITAANSGGNVNEGRTAPGSVSFVPSVAGLIMAGEIIKDIAFEK